MLCPITFITLLHSLVLANTLSIHSCTLRWCKKQPGLDHAYMLISHWWSTCFLKTTHTQVVEHPLPIHKRVTIGIVLHLFSGRSRRLDFHDVLAQFLSYDARVIDR